jgi:F-type H+-transporting ATPase subunit delta
MSTKEINAYADAVYAIAAAENSTAQVESELFTFAQAVANNAELRATLTDRRLPAAVRQQIVSDILVGEASHATEACLAMIIGTGRIGQIGEIAQALSTKSAAGGGASLATVRSAVPLTESQLAKLSTALSDSTGGEVIVKNIIDPSVIGGVLTQIGDEVIDGTIRSRLTRLRDAF